MPPSIIPTNIAANPKNSAAANELERRIQQRGRELFAAIDGQKPSVFDSANWTGRLMDWAMKKPEFRVRLLRFVDAYPSVTKPEQLHRLIQEYFVSDGGEVPAFLRFGAQSSGILGRAGHSMLNHAIRKNLEMMAQQFIVGSEPEEAMKGVARLREKGYATVLDLLGEAVVSEREAEEHQAMYLDMLEALSARNFDPLAAADSAGEAAGQDWGSQPIAQVSVKPSALFSMADPLDFEGSVRGILDRLRPIAAKARETGAALCLDMESFDFKDITIEVFRRLRAEFRDFSHLGIVLQAYLRDTEADLRRLLAWMRREDLPSAVRLVKGAYWDYETVVAAQNGWLNRVWSRKTQTDANFEKCARILLENAEHCYLACGSHNLRSIAVVLETARELNVPPGRFEFQLLYGMAEPVRNAIRDATGRVRLYAPFGELVPGMAYLVRRILENTANESFLRATFGATTDAAKLLADPAEELRKNPPKTGPVTEKAGFHNQPAADFTEKSCREALRGAIAEIRAEQLGQTRPLFVGGEEIRTARSEDSANPNRLGEVLGSFHLAGREEAANAVAAAKSAFPGWARADVSERAGFLRQAAEICRRRHAELAAWQVLEVGKQWHEATADVDETIDFFTYYAGEAERLASANPLAQLPGETNELSYVPRGVTAVIAPWNFPLAISAGMVSAAIVTGNPVVYKPSSLSALVGYHLVEIFREAGLPDGVFNFIPGPGGEIGDYLVDHPDIATIAFTGSREIGLRIIGRAAAVHPGQRHVKRVIAEMGGKNAVIIDDDADLDEAVPAVLKSAFGFQGQKCSACSRVVVLDAVHDRFVRRLLEAAKGWKIGPSEDPGHHMGAVIDAAALAKIREFAKIAQEEGTLAFSSKIPENGHFAPLTIVTGVRPEHRIAQEEVFGPILAVMRAADFDEALQIANSTPYALTGGVFSRTPSHLERARLEFDVGNLYLNRGITGALVGRQAFGGAAMSGVGSKAGGPDYLLQFVNPKVATENTMRRGFAPEV